jgi:hypothetical protein
MSGAACSVHLGGLHAARVMERPEQVKIPDQELLTPLLTVWIVVNTLVNSVDNYNRVMKSAPTNN